VGDLRGVVDCASCARGVDGELLRGLAGELACGVDGALARGVDDVLARGGDVALVCGVDGVLVRVLVFVGVACASSECALRSGVFCGVLPLRAGARVSNCRGV